MSARAWHESLERHCERYLGACPSAVGELVPGPVPLTLYPHLPSADRPWLTLRTGGVSDYPMSVPEGMDEYRYCELLTYLPAGWDLLGEGEQAWWPGRLLKQLGQFVHEQSTWFDDGHTVAVSDPGETYAPDMLTSAALLRVPCVEAPGFDPALIDGVPCRFLWVFPITEAEAEFKLKHGAGALLELIEAHQLGHVLDPGRACMISGRRP